MIYFNNDYSEGCHPKITQKFAELAKVQFPGYGLDEQCEYAKKQMQKHLKNDEVAIHFVVGGTQANLICLAAFLKPFEAIIACDTSHIAVHETGAIEATGHKICLAKEKEGKLTPNAIKQVVLAHSDEHMVKPRLVFISNSTELGTIYYEHELMALRQVCDQYGLLLYLDGARLGSAIMASDNDVSFSSLTHYFDAFYVGGTKNGALYGEAIVIVNPELKPNFRFHIKQRGALLAKGYTLGVQFHALFEDNLFFDIAAYANQLADKIRLSFAKMNISYLYPTTSNQIFPILSKQQCATLSKQFGFNIWEDRGDYLVVRIVTSWATDAKNVDLFCRAIEQI